MKFSIIVPVYNVEKFLDKCLNSICAQTHSDFEVIVVNDGSTDNSQAIIDRHVYKDVRFKSYIKSNGGLSDARNFGIAKATGDYLLFIDSDDYINNKLLENINNIIITYPYDVIKFNITMVDEAGNNIGKSYKPSYNGAASIRQVVDSNFFQPAPGYVYNLKFWKDNNFEFATLRVHEDFGLIPYIVAKANNIYMLDYDGYNYVQRDGSITNGGTKAVRRATDMLYHFDFLVKQIEPLVDINSYDKKYLLSFIANNTISILRFLDKKDLPHFISEMNKRHMYKYMLNDTIIRKIKKYIIKVNLTLYVKLFIK